MRGKEGRKYFRSAMCRITPAYAGKSHQLLTHRCQLEDHPRLCGEKFEWVFVLYVQTGITPAYAGKSGSMIAKQPAFEDHPRLCGEKTKKIPKQRYFFHQPASFSFSLQYT